MTLTSKLHQALATGFLLAGAGTAQAQVIPIDVQKLAGGVFAVVKWPLSWAAELAAGELTRIGNARQVDSGILQHAGGLKVQPRVGAHDGPSDAVTFQEGTTDGALGIDVLREFAITRDLGARRLRLTRERSKAFQDPIDGFAARTYVSRNGASMPYRLFIPSPEARRKPLPLVLYLHGGGGAGTDNRLQITGGNTLGTHLWTSPQMQARYPAFVLAPQLPGDEQWSAPASNELATFAALALDAIAEVSREFSIDATRLYITGQSRGGRGVWDIVSKRPRMFAAAVPLCGDGNLSRIAEARSVPIWAFHGAKDTTVPVEGSRALVAALRAAKGNVRYTEYPEAGHNVWTIAYAEPELAGWLFTQTR
jgi:poly(3-hydroxybutyrate) depolymerase